MKAPIRWGLIVTAAAVLAQSTKSELLNRKPVLDAHNCYPYDGRWSDRIDRALASGFPVSIEQDLAWYTAPGATTGRAVLVHNPKTMTGAEPGLREYFFERIRPLVEKELQKENAAQWPVILLHLDFKTNEAPLLKATWDLLGEYESWLTTARKSANPGEVAELDKKPVLVLTEDSDVQEEFFYGRVPAGSKLRLFGSAHTNKIPGDTDQQRAHAAVTIAPDQLLTERPTTYRRWWNNSWHVVEEGGQRHAGDWTAADMRRLRSLVDHAHRQGFPIRFFTIDGFTSNEDRGWDPNYNFGSRDAAVLRWKAAVTAGVDMISTDQYEDLASSMGRKSLK